MNGVAEKWCSDCRTPRPLASFHRNAAANDGLQHQCKACNKKRDGARRERKRLAKAAALVERLRLVAERGKVCTKCHELKPATAYKRDTSGEHVDGIRSECRACTYAAQQRWFHSNPDAQRKQRQCAANFRLSPDYLPNIRANRQRARNDLADSYVKKLLTDRTPIRPAEIPDELLELKREQLATARLSRQLRKVINDVKEPTNESQQEHD